MKFDQDKIDEAMRLLKQAWELVDSAVMIEDNDEDAPDTAVENEKFMPAIGSASRAIGEAIERLAPVFLEPG